MSVPRGEVILITGVNGFLGQHLLKQLLRDTTVREIRGLDKSVGRRRDTSQNDLRNSDKVWRFYEGDLIDVQSCREVIKNVDVVLHCAALISYEYPPNKEQLYRNNVEATENLLQLCIEEGVGRFVHCSTTEVAEQPYIRGGMFCLMMYQQEATISPPQDESKLIFGEYAASKLRSERIVLAANEKPLDKGKGTLYTVALRFTLLYGEGDENLIPHILKHGKWNKNFLSRPTGKQQITYVGNAAWAIICAKNILKENPRMIAGLPVIVTDDTQIDDINRFCEKITMRSKTHHMKFSPWNVPITISYLIAISIEILVDIGLMKKISVSRTGLISYFGSLLLYNRSRASINMKYNPIYSQEDAFRAASKYYSQLLDEI